MYRIDDKDGLAVVLREIEEYYSKLKNSAIDEKEDVESAIAKINRNIIDKINPRISSFEWMMMGINVSEYFGGWNRTKSTPYLKEFRRALEEFDRTINPFCERDLSTGEILAGLKDMKIRFERFRYERDSDEFKYYSICITDPKSNSSIRFRIEPAGFMYCYSGNSGDGEHFWVSHFYKGDAKDENRGEILEISYFGDYLRDERKICFNVTNGIIFGDGRLKRIATETDIALIYFELVKATKMAANITVNNFEKNKIMSLS